LRAVCTVAKLGTGTAFGWYIPEKGWVPGIPEQLARNLPGTTRAFMQQRGQERVWSAMEAALKDITDQQWSLMRFWHQQKALGMMPDRPLSTRLANMMRAPRSQGGQYPVKESYPETIFGKMWMRAGDIAYQLASIPEVMIQAASTYFPNGWGYNVNYETVSAGAAKYVAALAAHSRRTFETYEALGRLGQFNFDDLHDRRNVLAPWEVLPVNGNVLGIDPAKLPPTLRPNASTLTFARDLFSTSTDVDLNDLILRYWKRLSQTPREQRGAVEFLAPEEMDPATAERRADARLRGIGSRFVEQTHHQVPSNRPYWLHRNTYIQVIQPYMGWTIQTLKLIDTYLGGAQTSQWEKAIPLLIAGGMSALASLVWAATGGDTETRGMRAWDRFVNHKESTAKTIEEAQGPKEAAAILVHETASVIPFVNNAVNSLMGDTGYRGQMGMQAFGFDKVNALMNYFKGVIHTHDPTYGLPAIVEANFPFSEPFIENLMSRQGFQVQRNATRALQKFGPAELVEKKAGFGGGVVVPTELSPYKNALNEAVFSGQSDLIAKASQAFLAKAAELGRPEPDRLLAQVFGSMNPDRKAFGTLPTEQQHADAIGKMGDWERNQVQKAESNYAAAAQQLGLSANFVQEDTMKGGGGMAAGRQSLPGISAGLGGAASLGGGRMPAGMAAPRGMAPGRARVSLGGALRRPRLVSGTLRRPRLSRGLVGSKRAPAPPYRRSRKFASVYRHRMRRVRLYA
jgi:hypothetical protein